MSALAFWNPGDQVLVWGANVLCQVTLVATVALLTAALVRRSPALRYCVLSASLLLVLFIPAIALAMQWSGRSWLSVSLMDVTVTSAEAGKLATAVNVQSVAALPNYSLLEDPNSQPMTRRFSAGTFDPSTTDGKQDLQETSSAFGPPITSTPPVAIPPRVGVAAAPVATQSKATWFGNALRLTMPSLLILWSTGAILLLIRLVSSWCRLANILRSANPCTSESLAESFEQVVQELNLRRKAELVFSGRVSTPFAAGLFRPRVALPERVVDCMTSEQLRIILVHEVAHIVRHDQVLVLLQNLAAAIFWLHPLARVLNYQLAQAREEVCDNHVLATTNAPSYSRTLLTLGELIQTAHPLAGTVGLLTSRWSLECRVAGILDESRSRGIRLSARGKLLVAAASILTAAVAALGTMTVAVAQDEKAIGTTEAGKIANAAAPTKFVQVTGVVLKPDGTPAAGATVRAAVSVWDDLKKFLGADYKTPLSLVTTDAQGRFTIDIHTQPYGDVSQLGPYWSDLWKQTQVAAAADGYGPAWIGYQEIDRGQPITLQLVEDVPIRGRAIDLEGRPLAGIVVQIGGPRAANAEDLSKWLASVQAGESWTAYKYVSRSIEPRLIGTPEKITTANDGSFDVRGFGKERVLGIVFEGESVAHRAVNVVTRKMLPLQRAITSHDSSTEPVFGADFTFTAAPTRPIEGTVLDAVSRQPLAGVRVESYKLADYPFSGHAVLKTTTNTAGRFRLVGMPKAAGNILMLVPNDEQPYLMRRVSVPDPTGIEPVPMTIELHRGIWIQGRVTDKSTGEPVPGVRMHYLPFRTNEFAQALPEFDKDGNVDGDQMRYQTKADGSYRLVGLPGRAIVGAESIYKSYRYGVGYEAISAPKVEKSDWLLTFRNPINPGLKWPSVMRQIDPEKGVEEIKLDLELDPGGSLKIHIVDQSGQPVTGADWSGLSARFYASQTQDSVQTAISFGPDEIRPIIIHHKNRNIGRVISVGPPEVAKGEIEVKLVPCSTATGRLLSKNEPLSGLTIEPRVLPSGDFSKSLPPTATDTEGRFTCTLIQGCEYNLHAQGKGLDFYATVADTLAVEPGETKDLGTLTLAKKERKFVAANAPAASTAAKDQQKSSTNVQPKPDQRVNSTVIHCSISQADGKAASGAFVAAVGLNVQPKQQADDLTPWAEVLGEGQSDDAGRFELRLTGVSSKTHIHPYLIARTEESGIVWRQLDLDARDTDVKLELQPQQLIQTRLVDLEGQPAAGIRIQLHSIVIVQPVSTQEAIPFPVPPVPKAPGLPGRSGGHTREGIDFPRMQQPPKSWLGTLTTDDRGLLTIRNIAAGQGVRLTIEPTETFAPQDLSLNTGASEQRSERDMTYRSFVKNMKPGEIATIPLAPAQHFEGVVRFADTGQPVPHARLSIWASQQEKFGSMVSVEGKSDSQGRFRLNPKPGVRFGIKAFPPAGAPYQAKRLDDLRWKSGTTSQTIEIQLDRGVLARGKVLESGTNAPVHGASVQYRPDEVHNKYLTKDVVTGWQSIQKTDAEGNFQIAVLPGPGTLLVHGTQGKFIFQQIGSQQLDRGKPGGYRTYANAIQPIDPQPGVEFPELVLQLHRGKTIEGRLTNEAGDPIEHALIVSLLNISAHSPWWRGFTADARNGRFELGGMADGEKYLVHFLDAKQRLGATAMLGADDNGRTIVLRKCGDAKARFVNPQGKPVVGVALGLEHVMTPGKSRHDVQAMVAGELVADEDFAANIDRLNNNPGGETNDQGELAFPALIPGARYRFVNLNRGMPRIEKEFVAESGKTFELGQIVVQIGK